MFSYHLEGAQTDEKTYLSFSPNRLAIAFATINFKDTTVSAQSGETNADGKFSSIILTKVRLKRINAGAQ